MQNHSSTSKQTLSTAFRLLLALATALAVIALPAPGVAEAAASVDLQVLVNTEDADAAPGPYLVPGDPIVLDYVVTNVGDEPLTNISVSDGVLGSIACPVTDLAVGTSMACVVVGQTVIAGQYTATGLVSAESEANPGSMANSSDLVNYLGSVPSVSIEALTNGVDADDAPGVVVPADGVVNLSYEVANTGNGPLSNIAVTDDAGNAVTCPSTALSAGASMSCTTSDVAVEGQTTVIATVSADGPAITAAPLAVVETIVAVAEDWTLPGITSTSSMHDPLAGTEQYEERQLTYTNSAGVVVDELAFSVNVNGSFDDSLALDLNADGSMDWVLTQSDANTIFPAGPSSVYTPWIDASPYVLDVAVTATGTTVTATWNGQPLAPGAYTGPVGPPDDREPGFDLTAGFTLADLGFEDDGSIPSNDFTTTGIRVGSINDLGAGFAGVSFDIGVEGGTLVLPAPTVADSDPTNFVGQAQSISIEVLVNTLDVPAPGVLVLPGSPVVFDYVVENNGLFDLTDVVVTDDEVGVISCPSTTLAVGESMTCSATSTAVAGTYAAGVSATASSSNGPAFDGSAVRYVGSDIGLAPELVFEKTVNGFSTDSFPGVYVEPGSDVLFKYSVTNVSNTLILDVSIVDDIEGPVCGPFNLDPGEQRNCALAAAAVVGEYTNVASVSGTPAATIGADGTPNPPAADVGIDATGYYTGSEPSVTIVVAVNGDDANTGPGVEVPEGETVALTYTVTNDGNVEMSNVVVTDDAGNTITCPATVLAVGESMTCTATDTALGGNNVVIGSVSADAPAVIAPPLYEIEENLDADGVEWTLPGITSPVTEPGSERYDERSLTYTGLAGEVVDELSFEVNVGGSFDDSLAIDLNGDGIIDWVLTEGDADAVLPTGPPPEYDPWNDASPYVVSVTVTPTGTTVEATWNGVVITPGAYSGVGGGTDDDQGFDNVSDFTLADLGFGADGTIPSDLFTTTGIRVGNINDVGFGFAGVTFNLEGFGEGTVLPAETVTDSDPAHFSGASESINIEVAVNTVDAEANGGPVVNPGDPIVIDYTVTNDGPLALTNVVVTDDNVAIGTVTCPQTTLAVGETMVCTVTGQTAVSGDYDSRATATGDSTAGPVFDRDAYSYSGLNTSPAFTVDKTVNGFGSDSFPGIYVNPGDLVVFGYSVKNVSNVTLTNIDVVDDIEGFVCGGFDLIPGETRNCVLNRTAVAGDYTNVATASGTPPVTIDADGNPNPQGPDVEDSDDAFYVGVDPSLTIEVYANGDEADIAPGVIVAEFVDVDLTYEVENTGNVALTGVVVTDDAGNTISCPETELAPGESMTCTATGAGTDSTVTVVGSASGIAPAIVDTPPLVVENLDASDVVWTLPSHTSTSDTNVPGNETYDERSLTYTNMAGEVVDELSFTVDVGGTFDDSLAVDLNGDGTIDWLLTQSDAQVVDPAYNPWVDASPYVLNVTVTDTGTTIVATWNGEIITPGTYPGSEPDAQPGFDNTAAFTLSDLGFEAGGLIPSNDFTTTGIRVGSINDRGPGFPGVSFNLAGMGIGETLPPETVDAVDDPANYTGVAQTIDIELAVNTVDADTGPGPSILAGNPVTFTYVVTNNGVADVTNLVVTDDIVGAVTCPVTALAVGESTTCTVITETAVTGPYTSSVSATADGVTGQAVDADPVNYFGVDVTSPFDFEKTVNGDPADSLPGIYVVPGGPVVFEYTVTNTSNVPLTGVTITDDQVELSGVAACGPFDLPVGETVSCQFTDTAQAGAYTNVGTVTGLPPEVIDLDGNPVPQPPVTETDDGNYVGVGGALNMLKFVDGFTAGQNPTLRVGDPVTFTYFVSNSGNVDLTDVTFTDDVEDLSGVAACGPFDLAVGAVASCSLTTVVVAGDYANTGTVTGTPPVGDPVTDEDGPVTYVGSDPSIDLVKLVNGQPAGTNPVLAVGSDVVFTYTVTNDGNVDLTDVNITDDVEDLSGVAACGPFDLAVGASASCELTTTVVAGSYANTGTVTGTPPVGDPVTDEDGPVTYVGSDPSIDLVKLVNGQPAGTNPILAVGDPVTFTYTVTNDGNVDLTDVNITDDVEDLSGVAACGPFDLAVGAVASCELTTVVVAGSYENTGTAVGTPPPAIDPDGNPVPQPPVTDEDGPVTYVGSVPSIDLVKLVNGQPAGTNPVLAVGDPVTFTYTVTNTGNVDLTDVNITDDVEDLSGVAACGPFDLAVGEVASCELTTTVVAGSYANTGTVTGTPPVGDPVTDEDGPVTYVGSDPSIDLVKLVNGQPAGTNPVLAVGEPVTFTYTVTNDGNVDLTDVNITDDVEDLSGVAACGPFDLAVGAVASCELTTVVVAGSYENTGTAVGTPPPAIDPDGNPVPQPPVTDEDGPVTYVGSDPSIDLVKLVNGQPAGTNPVLEVGSDVVFTYTVTNDGNVDLTDVNITDDVEDLSGVAACGPFDLAVGASASCELTTVVVAGSYANTGTVTGTPPVGDPVTDEDGPVTYVGSDPSIDLVKLVNGQPAGTNPILAVGSDVVFTYTVTNTGNVDLTDVNITDDVEDLSGVAACGPFDLAVGASASCELTTVVVAGDYENTGTAVGTPPPAIDPDGNPVPQPPVTDEDGPVTYVGVGGALNMLKFVDGFTAGQNPTLRVGDPVTFTYFVSNSGNVDLTDVTFTDDVEDLSGVAACGPFDLAVGAVASCSLTTVVVAGSYANTGTVTGTPPVGDPVTDEDGPVTYVGSDPSIDLVKLVNGQPAGTNPVLEVGSDVVFTYTVTNDGNVDLTDVNITDDVEDLSGVAACGPFDLAVGAVASCELTTVVVAGSYANTGTVTGTPPVGDPVTDEDGPVTYVGSDPSIDLVKLVNGQPAGTNPILAVGSDVVFTYTVTNTGNVDLTDVNITDDVEDLSGVAACGPFDLAVGASASCELTTVVVAGDYANTGTVTGTPPVGDPVTDEDGPVTYVGSDPSIDLVKLVNGQPAGTNPILAVGDPVTFTYTVTNDGNVDLTDVNITDDVEDLSGVAACGPFDLAVGASASCELTTVVVAGDYENTGTAVGTPPPAIDPDGNPVPQPPVTDEDGPVTYVGVGGALNMLKFVDGFTAGQNPTLRVGDPVTFTYFVSNSGNVDLTDVTFTDDVEDLSGVAACGPFDLAVGAVASCSLTTVVVAGSYANTGTVTGTPPVGDPVTDEDGPVTYVGSDPSIDLVKLVNGQPAGTNPVLEVGSDVVFTYTVTNDGNVDLTDVNITDDVEDLSGVAACGPFDLAVGAVASCELTTVVVAGSYANTGTVTGTPPVGDPVTDEDGPVTYVGSDPSIDLVKLVNGQPAGTNPVLAVGDPVTFTYTVTNTGNVDLTDVNITDDVEDLSGVAACGPFDLAVGAVASCELTTVVVAGSYENTGTAVGTPPPAIDPDGNPVPQPPVTDEDGPVTYVGVGGVPSIELVKFVNGQPAGANPVLEVGADVVFTYTVTNTGNADLTGVNITDDVEDLSGIAACGPIDLAAGASASCSLTTTVVAGDYANTGTVTGTPPVGDPVTDEDGPVTYVGSDPSIDLVKLVNGQPAGTNPVLEVGSDVVFTYTVTNDGNVDLTDVNITDDVEDLSGVAACGPFDLAVGASASCELTTVVVAGSYANTGTVTGTPPVGDPVTDEDGPVTYVGSDPSIDLVKLVNGQPAGTNPVLAVGDPVTFTYTVTNTGNVDLTDVNITDDVEDLSGVAACGPFDLAVGAVASCELTTVVVAGSYENTGTAVGTPPPAIDPDGNPVPQPPVTDEDGPVTYVGVGGVPSIELVKFVNGQPAGANPVLEVGADVVFTYTVTNTGNADLTGVNITDDVEDLSGIAACGPIDLAAGASASCSLTTTVVAGDYANTGTVTGTPPVGDPVTDEDGPVTYVGSVPSIDLVKLVNGQPAGTNPVLEVGSDVVFTYTVTNDGNVDLTDVNITDDVEDLSGVAACGPFDLAVGASASCELTTTVVAGSYENTGTAVGTPPPAIDPDGNPVPQPPVTDEDGPVTYVGVGRVPSIELVKFVNGQPAGANPVLEVGADVVFTYTVTNTGNADLTGVNITDDVEDLSGIAACGPIDLAAGAVASCELTTTVVAGSYANTGTVTGTPPVGDPVTDEDGPVTYVGSDPSIDLVKLVNGQPAGENAVLEVGEPVTFTYTVTNDGNVDLTDVNITDDVEDLSGVAACGPFDLAVGEVASCELTTTVVAGDYANTGTVTGTPPPAIDPDSNPVPQPPVTVEDGPVTYVGAVPSIDLVKLVNGQPAGENAVLEVGEPVTFTYTVTNDGNVDLTDVNITDDVEDLSGIAACGPFDLAVGEVASCELTTTVVAGDYANTGTVTGTPPPAIDPDGNPVPQPPVIVEDGPVTYVGLDQSIEMADLSIVKTGTVEQRINGMINWKIVVTNNGPGVALPGAEMKDVLPLGASLVAVDAPSGWSCTDVVDVTCTLDDPMDAGETATFTIQQRISDAFNTAWRDAGYGTLVAEFENTASVALDKSQSDSDPGNNGSTVVVAWVTPPPPTGGSIAPFLMVGIGALLAGMFLVVADRRRRRQETWSGPAG